MRISNNIKFTNEELKEFKSVIHSNITRAISQLLDGIKTLGLSLHESNTENFNDWTDFIHIFSYHVKNLPENMIPCIKGIWNDESIQHCFKHSARFGIQGSIASLLNDVERILANDYVPSDQDILFSRNPTSVISENVFKINSETLVIYVFFYLFRTLLGKNRFEKHGFLISSTISRQSYS